MLINVKYSVLFIKVKKNERFTLKYWSEDLKKSVDLDIKWELGNEYYISNGLAAISSISFLNQIVDNNLVELFPNPCQNEAELSFYLPLSLIAPQL